MPASDQGVAHARHRHKLIPRVLCFVTHTGDVLLLKGAADKKIWAGRYNGLGGHVERGEGAAAAARREIREEAGLEVRDLRLRGVITIDAGEADGIALYVFTAEAVSRAARPSAEGALAWVPAARLAAPGGPPDLDLVEDLPALLPRLLAMRPEEPAFSASYTYDAEGRLVIAFDPAP
jgi:8-oxo-dGTP diphosphatase